MVMSSYAPVESVGVRAGWRRLVQSSLPTCHHQQRRSWQGCWPSWWTGAHLNPQLVPVTTLPDCAETQNNPKHPKFLRFDLSTAYFEGYKPLFQWEVWGENWKPRGWNRWEIFSGGQMGDSVGIQHQLVKASALCLYFPLDISLCIALYICAFR